MSTPDIDISPDSSGPVEPMPATALERSVGRYRLVAVLGRGGMSEVYLAVSRGPRGFNKLVVLKQLRYDMSSDPAFVRMFLEEARLAARLSHANVVDTYEVREDPSGYFIAMEYLEGQALNGLLRQGALDPEARLPAGHAVRILCDALSGLHYAHELRDYDGSSLDIIHRDISPHNLFVTYGGEVKLVDFGIAKATLNAVQTEAGVIKGKVAYMAPEQLVANGSVDRRADIFAMGVVLWELLTYRRLLSGGLPVIMQKLLTMTVMPRVSEEDPNVDPELDAIVAKALARDPEERYATAYAMREALEAWAAGRGLLVRAEDIARHMTRTFAGLRDETQQKIRAYMADIASGELAIDSRPVQSLPTLHSHRDPGDSGSSGRGLPKTVAPARARPSSHPPVAAGMSIGDTLVAGSSETPIALPVTRIRPKWIAIFALLGIVVLIAIFARWRRPEKEVTAITPPPSASAPRVPASDEPPPITSSAVAPTPVATIAVSAAPDPGTTQDSPKIPPKAGTAKRPTSKPAATSPAPQATATPQEAGPGYLSIDTYPWARVSEGTRVLGITPLLQIPLSPGDHVLTLENESRGLKQSYAVTIRSGETVARRLAFK